MPCMTSPSPIAESRYLSCAGTCGPLHGTKLAKRGVLHYQPWIVTADVVVTFAQAP